MQVYSKFIRTQANSFRRFFNLMKHCATNIWTYNEIDSEINLRYYIVIDVYRKQFKRKRKNIIITSMGGGNSSQIFIACEGHYSNNFLISKFSNKIGTHSQDICWCNVVNMSENNQFLVEWHGTRFAFTWKMVPI